MPLPDSLEREELHQRQISMRSYRRSDGLFDIEARVVDTKSAPFLAPLAERALPAGEPIHDLWIRLVVDEWLVIHEALACSDATPFGICRQAPPTLAVLKGERIGAGWSRIVREKLKGAASCTHLMELLIPMATTAMQTLWPFTRDRPLKTDENGRPLKIDSCFAYSENREVVLKLWPQHYKGPRPN